MLPDPVLPPLLEGHPVKAPQRPWTVAIDGAAAGRYGAGSLIWARDTAWLDCALVLEPEVDPSTAAQMLLVALVAMGDSLGQLVPPEVAVTFGWPDILRLNGGKIGSVRAVLSPDRDDAGAPRWMVLGTRVELRRPERQDPGLFPDETDLFEEGCGAVTRTDLLDAYSRHLLAWTDSWEREGFRKVAEHFLYRAEAYRQAFTVHHGGRARSGTFLGLDEAGGLLLDRAGHVELLSLLDHVEAQLETGAVS